MRSCFLILSFIGTVAAQAAAQRDLPSVDDVVAQMMEHDNQRQAALHGYTVVRRYVLENSRHHKRAEMLVAMKCLDNGSKQFQTLSATGWSAARNHVFPRLLESESEASLPDVREQSRITPENYSFEMVGRDFVDQHPAYVIGIAPKSHNKYLVRGKIWVDADDYAIVRIEGEPAKTPSFWIKSTHFIHTYQKNGMFWLPSSDHSVTDARIVGATELKIEYFDYAANTMPLASVRSTAPGSLP
jgi:hypothetical protein